MPAATAGQRHPDLTLHSSRTESAPRSNESCDTPTSSFQTSDSRLARLEILLQPFPHAAQRRFEAARLPRYHTAFELRLALQQQAHRRGETRVLHHFSESARIARHAQS